MTDAITDVYPKGARDLKEDGSGSVSEQSFLALAEGNIPQIMILACFLGFLMRNLDNQTDKLNTTMDDLYTVFLNAIEYSVSFLPLFIFASLTGLLWENGYHAERTGHSPEWTRDCQRSGSGV